MSLPADSIVKTKSITEIYNPRRRFVIGMRDPWQLPEDKIDLPGPGSPPSPPGSLNLWITFLPPSLMIIGSLLTVVLGGFDSTRLIMIAPMVLMGLGIPVANIVNNNSQKKKYQENVLARQENYQKKLAAIQNRLEGFVDQQRQTLEREAPELSRLLPIALDPKLQRHRLWVRRPHDVDFLALRVGLGTGEPTFSVVPPRVGDSDEPLIPLAIRLADSFREVPKLPILVNLSKVGSTAISGRDQNAIYATARRLILDVLIHHSPLDVQVMLITDHDDAEGQWGWLKWAPHTRSLLGNEKVKHIATHADSIDTSLEWLSKLYEDRRRKEASHQRTATDLPAIVVVFDDRGDYRQSADVAEMAAYGLEVGIYTLFVGGRTAPRECRSRLEVSSDSFHYVETWAGAGKGIQRDGYPEPASRSICEQAARSMAQLEPSGEEISSSLPESTRLADVFQVHLPTIDLIKENWQTDPADDSLLHFPFGLQATRKGLQPIELNLLPENKKGMGYYHTILIGTTGSGKSEFMKSLVMAAAYKYSPKLLNFFFLDFKGGAAFNIFSSLAHVVGIVTNLSPDLVERGLSAIDAEIDRRQREFADAHVHNIWAYNEKFPKSPMPHLMLLLDEFARGMEDFPRLPGILDLLVRQGRSLGMYLFLANQDVSSAVDKLLNNVGWHILLKVAKESEMHIISKHLSSPRRAGHGYLHSISGDYSEFQAAYAGLDIPDEKAESHKPYRIFRVAVDGNRKLLYEHKESAGRGSTSTLNSLPSEQDHLLGLFEQAQKELDIPPTRKIYMDPLPEVIPLEEVFGQASLQPIFSKQKWESHKPGTRIAAPIGFIDIPEACCQECLEVDFKQKDGHIWILGAAGSGKSMTVETILLSLALTHTPDQVQFYIIEYGSGALSMFDGLPHTGAILRLTDPLERLERLLNFLDGEMDRRGAHSGRRDKEQAVPELFLVINNYAEMRAQYGDQAERIMRYARDGKSAGLHLILTTNRKGELTRLNIARKIVLTLSSRDEYVDALGKPMLPSKPNVEGRGFWIDEQITECQVAQPVLSLQDVEPAIAKRDLFQAMDRGWKGGRPRQIRTVPECISLPELWEEKKPRLVSERELDIPVGLDYETMEVIAPNILGELPHWLVIGPRQSGRSNLLACLAASLLEAAPDDWNIRAVLLRPGPLNEWLKAMKVDHPKNVDEILKICQDISVELDVPENSRKHTMIMVDDLGAAFEQGREPVAAALNSLASKCSTNKQVHWVVTGLLDELRTHMNDPLVRYLRQAQTGVGLTKDPTELDWLGFQLPLQYRRVDLPIGRGFWVSNRRARFIQSPKFEA